MADEVETKATDDIHDAAPQGTPRRRARAPSVGPDVEAQVEKVRQEAAQMMRQVQGKRAIPVFKA